jgi:competence protein ComFC
MLQFLLALFFPAKSEQTHSLPVFSNLAPVRIRQEELRSQGIMHLDGLTAAATYASSKDLQEAIRRFKYHKQRSLADPLGRILSDAFMLLSPNNRTAFCPVPLHWSRRFARGFNQAELLARALSQSTRLPITMSVRRVRPTGHQAWRSHDERRLAMHDAFVARDCDVSHITLVDDVATTMSTLDACAYALKSAGVAHVDAIVIALG